MGASGLKIIGQGGEVEGSGKQGGWMQNVPLNKKQASLLMMLKLVHKSLAPLLTSRVDPVSSKVYLYFTV